VSSGYPLGRRLVGERAGGLTGVLIWRRVRVQRGGHRGQQPHERREAGAPGETLALAQGGYAGGLDMEYAHKVINHAEAYAKGSVHTNGLENFWSLLKRGIGGTYVSVEPFHLFRYLDEQAFRFNRRKVTDGERFAALAGAVQKKRLTYTELTGGDPPGGALAGGAASMGG